MHFCKLPSGNGDSANSDTVIRSSAFPRLGNSVFHIGTLNKPGIPWNRWATLFASGQEIHGDDSGAAEAQVNFVDHRALKQAPL